MVILLRYFDAVALGVGERECCCPRPFHDDERTHSVRWTKRRLDQSTDQQEYGFIGHPNYIGGGVTFTPTNAFKSLSLDAGRVILDNTTVQPGIVRFGNDSIFSVLTSSDLSKKAETIGVSDAIQFDITSILPSDVRWETWGG